MSITVELPDPIKTKRENQTSVGINLGSTSFATYFDGQMTYKAERNGNFLFKADKWYASSKTCFECKKKKDSLPLSVRTWRYACGTFHDREENAAKNLRFEAVEQYRLYLLEKKLCLE